VAFSPLVVVLNTEWGQAELRPVSRCFESVCPKTYHLVLKAVLTTNCMQTIAYTLYMNLQALLTHSNRSCAVLESPGLAAFIAAVLHVKSQHSLPEWLRGFYTV